MNILLLCVGIWMFLSGMLLRQQNRSERQKRRQFSYLAYFGLACAVLGGILLAEPVLSQYPPSLVLGGAVIVFILARFLLFHGW